MSKLQKIFPRLVSKEELAKLEYKLDSVLSYSFLFYRKYEKTKFTRFYMNILDISSETLYMQSMLASPRRVWCNDED